ncbi:VCBS domain-containing protein [Methylobrevis pamukkalensis]|nr:VCBS domain-containing protein [Methylobrevis pamukkalensis]
MSEDGEWTYVLDNASEDVQALGEGVFVDDQITVISDNDTKLVVTVRVTGTNDLPDITLTATDSAVAEDSDTSASGTISIADVDTEDASYLAYSSVEMVADGWTLDGNTNTWSQTSNYGTIVFNPDTGAYVYTLDNSSEAVQGLKSGSSETDTFTIHVTDGWGTSTKDIAITVTGQQDAPTVTVGDVSGDLAEEGTLTATATVTAADVDAGETAVVSPIDMAIGGWTLVDGSDSDYTKAGTYGTAVFDSLTGVVTYTLDNESSAVQDLGSAT